VWRDIGFARLRRGGDKSIRNDEGAVPVGVKRRVGGPRLGGHAGKR